MKNSLIIKALIAGLFSAITIGALTLLTYKTEFGIFLIASFGSTMVLLYGYPETPFAQPKNIFFGHLISILVGIIFNEIIGFSFYSLGLSVGVAVTLMIYLKVMHPPAASNPLVALFMDLSYDFILFPVITGTILIIVMSVFINRVILKRKYPNKWFKLNRIKKIF